MMKRLLLTDKQLELSREAFSRAAWQSFASSQPTRQAASHSGRTPESVAGGTRSRVACEEGPGFPNPFPGVLRTAGSELGLWLLIVALAACCVLVRRL